MAPSCEQQVMKCVYSTRVPERTSNTTFLHPYFKEWGLTKWKFST